MTESTWGDGMQPRVDHVGVIVSDLPAAVSLLCEVFGFVVTAEVERSDLRARFVTSGDIELELIEILEAEQRARRLGQNEARIEHIAIEVFDMESTLRRLGRWGGELSRAPQRVERYDMCMTRPETTAGITYQIVERKEGRGSGAARAACESENGASRT